MKITIRFPTIAKSSVANWSVQEADNHSPIWQNGMKSLIHVKMFFVL